MRFTLPAGEGAIKWSVHMNKCIDIAGGGTSLGTNILMWNCHEEPNQQFILVGPTSIRWAAHPDKCLHVKGLFDDNLVDGTNIELGNCDMYPGYPLREFIIPASDGLIHFLYDPTKCLAVAGDRRKPSDGANLEMWSCNSSEKNPNMQFTLP